jgi:dihydropteroate synthase
MGIVNRTPDSFFDGGSFLDDGAARARVNQLVRDGADIIDVGAESTRPGAPQVHPQEQIDRIGDAIAWVLEAGAIASVDTTSPAVAEHAAKNGARMINSVSLAPAAELARVAAHHDADLVLTHCRGAMSDMLGFSTYDDGAYDDVVADVAREWRSAASAAEASGLPREQIVFDPGLGFAKNANQSLELCVRLSELKERVGGHRVLVGTGRKSFVAKAVAAVLGGDAASPADRLGGTIAATVDCVRRGADIVRVHDVAPIRQALAYNQAVEAHGV